MDEKEIKEIVIKELRSAGVPEKVIKKDPRLVDGCMQVYKQDPEGFMITFDGITIQAGDVRKFVIEALRNAGVTEEFIKPGIVDCALKIYDNGYKRKPSTFVKNIRFDETKLEIGERKPGKTSIDIGGEFTLSEGKYSYDSDLPYDNFRANHIEVKFDEHGIPVEETNSWACFGVMDGGNWGKEKFKRHDGILEGYGEETLDLGYIDFYRGFREANRLLGEKTELTAANLDVIMKTFHDNREIVLKYFPDLKGYYRELEERILTILKEKYTNQNKKTVLEGQQAQEEPYDD